MMRVSVSYHINQKEQCIRDRTPGIADDLGLRLFCIWFMEDIIWTSRFSFDMSSWYKCGFRAMYILGALRTYGSLNMVMVPILALIFLQISKNLSNTSNQLISTWFVVLTTIQTNRMSSSPDIVSKYMNWKVYISRNIALQHSACNRGVVGSSSTSSVLLYAS